MARISDDDVERVRAATDIVQLVSERVELKQRGRDFWGCCPFHHEKTPSFVVHPDTQLWHCFGCGTGGDAFGFIMRLDNMEFPDVVRMLAERAHIEIVEEGGRRLPQGYKERLKALMKESADFYQYALMRNKTEKASEARAYLSARGFSADVCRRWNLGYAPGRGALVRHLTKAGFSRKEIVDANMAMDPREGDNTLKDRFFERIMFPINDASGATIAFGGRVIGPTPPNTGKYVNTRDTPVFNKRRHMFAFDRAKNSITNTGTAVVVEGYTDVIALHENGITNVVATLGTSLTPEHLRLLRTARPKKIVYLFDGDDAGQKAADRAAQFIDYSATQESGRDYVELTVAVIPGGNDPAEYVEAVGAKGMQEVIDSAEPLIRFAIDRRLASWDLSNPGQRMRALEEVAQLLAPIKGTLLSDDYANYTADALGAQFDTVRSAFAKAKPAPRMREEESAPVEAPVDDPRVTQARERGAKPLPEPRTEAQRCERELLALAAANPKLLPRLQDAFGRLPWSSEQVVSLAVALIVKDPSTSPATIAAELDREVPGAAAYLSGAQVSAADDQALNATVRRLITRITEIDLMNRIRYGNEKLKKAAQNGQDVDNNLFAEVAKLQQELKDLRNASK